MSASVWAWALVSCALGGGTGARQAGRGYGDVVAKIVGGTTWRSLSITSAGVASAFSRPFFVRLRRTSLSFRHCLNNSAVLRVSPVSGVMCFYSAKFGKLNPWFREIFRQFKPSPNFPQSFATSPPPHSSRESDRVPEEIRREVLGNPGLEVCVLVPLRDGDEVGYQCSSVLDDSRVGSDPDLVDFQNPAGATSSA